MLPKGLISDNPHSQTQDTNSPVSHSVTLVAMETQVIYTRVSGLKQDDGFSRRIQMETCDRYGELKGWKTYGYFHDTQSGSDYKSRKAVQDVLRLLQTGLVQHVTFPVIDRIGRDMHVIETFIQEIYTLGGKVSVASSGATYDSAEECITDNFFEIAVADYEKRKIRKRTGDGRKRSFLLGSYAKRPPYGYKIKSVTKTFEGRREKFKELEPVNSDIETIRLMLEKFVETRSKVAVLKFANANKLSHSGEPKEFWHYSTILSVINNADLYAGIPQIIKYQDAKPKKSRETGLAKEQLEENLEIEYTYPPVISRELADKVRVSLTLSDNAFKRGENHTPFLKLVFCTCGKRANYFKDKTHSLSRFMCSTGAQSKNHKSLGSKAYHDSPCMHSISPVFFIKAITDYLESLDSQEFVSRVSLAYEETYGLLQTLEGLNLDISRERESLISKRAILTDKLLTLDTVDNPYIVEAIGEEFKLIQLSLESLAQKENENLKEIARINRMFNTANIQTETYHSSILDMEKTVINTDSLMGPIKELQAELQAGNWERVSYLMAYLGLRMVADFRESNQALRRASVRVETNFDDVDTEPLNPVQNREEQTDGSFNGNIYSPRKSTLSALLALSGWNMR